MKLLATVGRLLLGIFGRGPLEEEQKQQAKFNEVIADFTKAIRLDPKDAKAYFYRGVAYREKGEPDKAIADFTEAIAINPTDAEAYFGRGMAYREKGEQAKAEADFARAKELLE